MQELDVLSCIETIKVWLMIQRLYGRGNILYYCSDCDEEPMIDEERLRMFASSHWEQEQESSSD